MAAHKATSDDPVSKKRERFLAKLKTKIVTNLVRGESIELLACEYGTTAVTISKWSDDFLATGKEEELKKRRSSEKSGNTKCLLRIPYRSNGLFIISSDSQAHFTPVLFFQFCGP